MGLQVQPSSRTNGTAALGEADDSSDLNALARQTLAGIKANVLPPEPFPAGFDLAALASTSRSSHPPARRRRAGAEGTRDGGGRAEIELAIGVLPDASGRRMRRARGRCQRHEVELAWERLGRQQVGLHSGQGLARQRIEIIRVVRVTERRLTVGPRARLHLQAHLRLPPLTETRRAPALKKR